MTAKSGEAALNRADNYTSFDSGYCLKYVRGPCWDVGSLYASAIDAWNGAFKKHPGDRNPPTGAPCFYRGGQYGHIVIYRKHGSGNMRSTDCQSAGHVSNAALAWPENHWGQDYLGWTEDLNGVDLPLGGEDDDMPISDDDLSKIAKRINQVLGDFTADGSPRDLDSGSAGTQDQADTRLRQIETVVRDIQDRVKRIENQTD